MGNGGHGGTHHEAGAGGQPVVHSGLPVQLPLPIYAPGSQTFDVRSTSEQPQRDAGGIGAARTRCDVSHVNFDDAVVYPGQPGRAHAHQYAGADKVDAFGIDPTSGGTCRGGTANLSAYWWPALLSPSGAVQRPVYVDVYYKASNYDTSGPVNPPPKGLKLLAGDAAARAAQSTNRFYWSCGDNNGQKSATVPSCGSQPTVLNVTFPQCLRSLTELSSPDGKSHASYPSGGQCPSSHPAKIPAITYHIYFRNVPAGARLSCDAATGSGGYCIHGDIIVNWDETIMRGMVEGCINRGLSGGSHLTCEGREYF